MSAAARRYGAQLIRGEVVALPTAGGAVETVVLADGLQLAADVVVNAAGPDAGRIAALAGVELPLERVAGLLIVTAPAPAHLRHVLYAPSVNLRPDGGARLMIQPEALDDRAVEGTSLPIDDPLVGDGIGKARAVVPALAGNRGRGRAPRRAPHAEGRPAHRRLRSVGRQPVPRGDPQRDHPGSKVGLLVTEELAGGDGSPLEPYRPSRFAPGAALPMSPAHGSSD